MPRLAIATTSVGSPMGPQVYERELTARAGAALGSDWEVLRTVVRSVRSELPGNRRLPFNHLDRAPSVARRGVGAVLYPRGAFVHRMDLSLPPAPDELVTVHDLVAWDFRDEAPPTPHARAEVRRARAVVCPSSFTASRVQEDFGVASPHVIPNGVDTALARAVPLGAGPRARLGLPDGRYVLHAGGASLRKNLEGLAAAWPKVRAEHPDLSLVLSGPPHPRRDRLFGPLAGAHRIGRIPDADVPGLLAGAAVVVVPSTCEGFGLPALEAMATGAAVVAAARGALPEVCGDAAVLTEPDGPSLADGILHALADSAEIGALTARARRRALDFSWDRCASAYADLWRSLA